MLLICMVNIYNMYKSNESLYIHHCFAEDQCVNVLSKTLKKKLVVAEQKTHIRSYTPANQFHQLVMKSRVLTFVSVRYLQVRGMATDMISDSMG
jgi:hypothetical protein